MNGATTGFENRFFADGRLVGCRSPPFSLYRKSNESRRERQRRIGDYKIKALRETSFHLKRSLRTFSKLLFVYESITSVLNRERQFNVDNVHASSCTPYAEEADRWADNCVNLEMGTAVHRNRERGREREREMGRERTHTRPPIVIVGGYAARIIHAG